MKKLMVMLVLGIVSGAFLLADEPAGKPAAEGGKDGRGDRTRDFRERQKAMAVDYLKATDPAKYEELKKLKGTNPEEFKKQVEAVKAQLKEKFQKELDEMKVLADKYRETKSDADKAALRAKMEESMKKRLEFQKQRIVDMEKSVVEAKEKLAEAEKGLQAKIDEKLNDILAGKTPGADAEKTKKDEKAK
ncbi:MAG TPA: hypothetical protein DET40_05430 [Lentisphaeria bacterium]|nr:MAG: hypothetical protein A2X45_16080 [Lentisphaerae bacterium GWF2_50_93]HCE42969.1 hypothetical protein [Lentisphaeria bacterium]